MTEVTNDASFNLTFDGQRRSHSSNKDAFSRVHKDLKGWGAVGISTVATVAQETLTANDGKNSP